MNAIHILYCSDWPTIKNILSLCTRYAINKSNDSDYLILGMHAIHGMAVIFFMFRVFV